MSWQVGDKMTMYFSIAGVVSDELLTVMEITPDEVALDDIFEDEDGNDCYRRFDRRSGQCKNDNTWMGGKRYIKRCKE